MDNNELILRLNVLQSKLISVVAELTEIRKTLCEEKDNPPLPPLPNAISHIRALIRNGQYPIALENIVILLERMQK
jgi:hypothetical protein